MSRRKSRILAFQGLFSWDASKSPLEDILSFSWLQKDTVSEEDSTAVETISETAQEERTFASFIISGTIDHIDEIDKKIESHLSASWSLDRINKVTLAILRTSVYEILFQKDIDKKIVIDEAVNIARDYGTDDSYKFINAVLDKIGKDEEKQNS